MTCASVSSLLDAYLDDELDPNHQAVVSEHLETCAACRTAVADLTRLRADMREHLPYYRASDALRQRIVNSLPEKSGNSAALKAPLSKAWTWKRVALACAAVLALSLGMNVFLARSVRDSHQELAQEVLSGHIRSLLGTHAAEVISTDRHTVKPWFNGKLDFSPDVKDLAPQGYPLVGGRLDYIGERRVAALLFHQGQHTISLFEWPGRDAQNVQFSRDGLSVIGWTRDGISYWAASDISGSDLLEFAKLYRKQ